MFCDTTKLFIYGFLQQKGERKTDPVSGQMTDESGQESKNISESENLAEGSVLETKVGGRKINDGTTYHPSYEYELIGVTVHTGTADGGHYYAFIRDKSGTNGSSVGGSKSNVGHTSNNDKWYSFNDAEVKQFDPSQLASECFGGEMNSRTYDQVTDKFMDLSIEKTNSAYMLFYERVNYEDINEAGPSSRCSSSETTAAIAKPSGSATDLNVESSINPAKEDVRISINLSQNLEDWIWIGKIVNGLLDRIWIVRLRDLEQSV